MASAPVQQGLDRVAPPSESVELPGTLMVGAEEKSAGSENLKEKIPSTNDEKIASPSGPRDATSIQPPRERTDQLESLAAGADHSTVYQPNIYAPQAQTIYYGAYKNPPGKWDEHPQFLNPEGMEMGSQGAPSLMFHTGYGYSPRMPYGPYSPVATPLPSARGDGQMYSTQQFPVTVPYIQQPGPNAMPFFNLPTQASQTDIIMPVGIEQQGDFLADSDSNGMLFGPRPIYSLSNGSSGRGSFYGSLGNPNFYDFSARI